MVRKYSVGGYNGDAASEFLLKKNLKKVKAQLATNDKQNALKLEAEVVLIFGQQTQKLGTMDYAKTEKQEKLFRYIISRKQKCMLQL